MKNPIRPDIQALSAYYVPDASGLIKLDAMENPYTWPESMTQAWLQTLSKVSLNRYPDPGASALNTMIRRSFDLPEACQVILGNGSDELIQIILMAIAADNATVMSVEPSFVMYQMISKYCRLHYQGIPLTPDFELDKAAILKAIKRRSPEVIFIAYPNNPTGNLFDPALIAEIIQTTQGLVVIDEAYAAFSDHSFKDDLQKYDNLLLMRTVSKMGLAGLRLGYLCGPAALVSELDKLRLPYNINSLTQASAEFALLNRDEIDKQTHEICIQRENLFKKMLAIDSLKVYPSQANFILFRCPADSGDRVFKSILDEGVLIKNLSKAGPALKDCLRVTVGTPEQNAAFINSLIKAI